MAGKSNFRSCSIVTALTLSALIQMVGGLNAPNASAIGPVAPVPAAVRPVTVPSRPKQTQPRRVIRKNYPGAVRLKRQAGKKKKVVKKVVPAKPPQDLISNMTVRTIAPGVVHKMHRGALHINVLDIDLIGADVHVKPVLASESFNRLDEVKDQASRVSAIAAVNGNYFKKDGTPLGTLLMDGEWVAGPIYDRTSLGITADGQVLVDRVNLHGTLETSNPDVPSIWVNNINQPRRSGSHLILYTRRWGNQIKMAYPGCLIAVDASGRIIDKADTLVGIPYGGFVLSDSKSGDISKLNVGDLLNLRWHTKPENWSKVVHAVSGGPVLIRDGNLYIGLKDEGFRKSWTGRHITARTAVGVTANRHLLLATIEGPHTLWDVAKMLKKLGAVDAMNLDGGGSTTMVVEGTTVTRNKSTFQRRVASSLVVLSGSDAGNLYKGVAQNYLPQGDMVNFTDDAPAVAPDVANSFELLNTEPPVVQRPVQPVYMTPNVPEPVTVEASEPKKGKLGKVFGWMKHIIP